MAVNINTKFYEEYNGEWHDLSKIVFTSPYLDSPNSAGVRSHILPGRAKLGLWYEDSSNMYRIMENQGAFVSGTQNTYIGRLSIYEGQTFNFNNDNTIMISLGTASGTLFNEGDTLYYDVDNYGVIDYKNPVTESEEQYVEPAITISNESFEGDIRKGLDYNVYWETEGIYTDDYMNIYYSTNAGVSWVLTASGVPNDGVAPFNIPTTTSQAQIKIEWTEDPSVDNTSSIFSVVEGDVEILKPDSDSVLETRIPQRVWWNSDNFFLEDTVTIDISLDGGSSWDTTVSGLSNDGYADIQFPINYDEESLIVRVRGEDEDVSDISDSFSVQTTASIDIVYPEETGVVIGNGNVHRVWWNSDTFYDNEDVSVFLSVDNGNNWSTLASGVSNKGYYDVYIPHTIVSSGTDALFKVGYTGGIDRLYDTTENAFDIVRGSLDIVYPTGSGVVITNGENVDVWWNSDYVYNNADVSTYLSTDGGSSYTLLTSGINEGHTTGLVSVGSPTEDAKIKVEKSVDDTVYDISTYSIEIDEPYLDVISPISGSELRKVSEYDDIDTEHDYKLWWNTNVPDVKLFDIYFSIDGGSTWSLITSSGTNTGYELVDVVKQSTTNSGKFKVEYTNDAGDLISAESDEFTVIDRINKLNNSVYDNFNLEADYATCTYSGIPYFYNSTDNKIYKMQDNDFEQILTFTEGGISNPLFTIKNDNFYIADGNSLSLYEYVNATGEWRTLSPLPGTGCVSSPSDDDEYLYSIDNDNVWCRLSTTNYGEWSRITYTNSGTGEESFVYSSYNLLTESVGSSYFSKTNVVYEDGSVYLPIVLETEDTFDGSTYKKVDLGLINITTFLSEDPPNSSFTDSIIDISIDEDYISELVDNTSIYGGSLVCSLSVVSDSSQTYNAFGYILNYYREYDSTIFEETAVSVLQTDDFSTAYSTPYLSTYLDTLTQSDRINNEGKFSLLESGSSFLTFFFGYTEYRYDLTYIEYNVLGEGSGNNYMSYIGKPTTFRNIHSNSLLINNKIYVSAGEYSLLPYCVYDLSSETWSVPTITYFNSSNTNVDDLFYNRKYDIVCTDEHNIYKFLGYNQAEFYKYSLPESVTKEDINSNYLEYIIPAETDTTNTSDEGVFNYVVTSGTVSYTVTDGVVDYDIVAGNINYTVTSGTIADDLATDIINDSLSNDSVDYKLPNYLVEYGDTTGDLYFTTLSGTMNYVYDSSADSALYQVDGAYINYNRPNTEVRDLKYCTVALGKNPSMDYCSNNNSIYVCTHDSSVNGLWKYDINMNSWDSTSDSPYVIDNGHVCCIGEYVYVIEGGATDAVRCLRYSTNNDTWESLSNRPSVNSEYNRVVQSVTKNGSLIYALVKVSYEEVRIYEYDTNTDVWDLFLRYSDIRFRDFGNASILIDDNYIYSVIDYGSVSGTESIVDFTEDGIYKNKLSNDNLSERQPDSFEYPSGYRKLEAPGGWSAPVSINYGSLSESPSTWVAPSSQPSLAAQEPDTWVAPISLDDKQTEPTGLDPIPSSPPTISVPYAYQLGLKNVVGTASIDSSDELYVWGDGVDESNISVHIKNSILFEVTNGECYNCRLTAWDDVTHSTLQNELLMTDRCRVTACAFNCYNSSDDPYDPEGLNSFVFHPVVDQKLKGDIYYYGDFDLSYKFESNVYGDYVIFMPYLDNVDETISYGIHDFIITFHYSYT